MDYQSNDSGDQVVLILESELNIQSAGELKELLILCSENDDLVVDLNSVASIDLSAMQLFCSLHRTMLKLGRKVSLAGGVPATLTQYLEDAGYLRDRSCALDKSGSCLWLKGGSANE